jgi:hypothetical protein
LAAFGAEFARGQDVDPAHVAARVYASIGFTATEDQLGFQRGPVTG